jgi:hypothetical protein
VPTPLSGSCTRVQRFGSPHKMSSNAMSRCTLTKTTNCSNNIFGELVILKTDPRQSRLDNELNILKELRGCPTVRQLVDEIKTGPELVLEYVGTDLLKFPS